MSCWSSNASGHTEPLCGTEQEGCHVSDTSDTTEMLSLCVLLTICRISSYSAFDSPVIICSEMKPSADTLTKRCFYYLIEWHYICLLLSYQEILNVPPGVNLLLMEEMGTFFYKLLHSAVTKYLFFFKEKLQTTMFSSGSLCFFWKKKF